jgi:predicted amidohydrolase
MKILSLQLPVWLSDLEKNRKTFLEKIAELTSDKATIMLLPEMWGCGFDYDNLKSFAEETEFVLKEIMGIINDNTLVISTLPEKNQNKVYNTVYAVTKNGVIGKYRKNFLFSPLRENEYIDNGNNITVVDFMGVKIGLQLCYQAFRI